MKLQLTHIRGEDELVGGDWGRRRYFLTLSELMRGEVTADAYSGGGGELGWKHVWLRRLVGGDLGAR